ncbi:MAG: SCO6745 family protein [Ilumatobacteraceae bacterium]
MPTDVSRSLAAALEPVTGQVYFSPECHANYERLGFGPSKGLFNGVMAPDGPAYFTSRGSVMGQVAGDVVAAAFAVFNPAVVVPAVAHGWSLTDAVTICAARDDGGIAQLVRVLGDNPDGASTARDLLRRAVEPLRPEGRPLYAGLRSQNIPDSLVGEVWRLGDMLREYRGDSHTAAWISAGFDACEIGVVSELYWGLPLKSYSRSRGWTDDDYAVALERLERDGLVADGALTRRGREVREQVEIATDLQMRPVVSALGDAIGDLVAVLRPWGATVRAAQGYPAAGPHDLADAASS